MIVVYATDDNYVPWCGISILSLFDNNREIEQLYVVVLDNGIQNEGKKHLNDIAVKYGRSITFVDASAFHNQIDFDADSGGFNQTTLVRLFLPKYLSHISGKILYIDCDTIITGSIAALENEDMTSYDIAAVPELYMPAHIKKRIGLSASDTYYNAGVILVNLDSWRKRNLTNKFLSYYRSMNNVLLYSDQDILNYCCKGRILTISQTYNLNPNLCYFPYWFVKRLHQDYVVTPCEKYEQIIENPCICHYMGDERPWLHGNYSSFRDVFIYYKAMSPWKNMQEIRGHERYLFFYHLLNEMTRIFPHGRIAFSRVIGIYKYQITENKS